MSQPRNALIILAAGESSRLGQPKQLVKINGKSLIKHVVEEGINAEYDQLIIVLGKYSEIIAKELTEFNIDIVLNPDFKKGISSSIAVGISQLDKCDYAVFCVCDQPFIKQRVFNDLNNAYSTGDIIISEYENGRGTPMLFDHKYFDELKGLQGDEGARQIVSKYSAKIKSIYFEKGYIDIDTVADIEKFLNKKSPKR